MLHFILFLINLVLQGICHLKVGVNPEIWENRMCRNFETLTVMYVKLYISGMEMSQRIRFWHLNLLKITIFQENEKQKQNTLVKKNFKWPTKCNFELKMLKLHEKSGLGLVLGLGIRVMVNLKVT